MEKVLECRDLSYTYPSGKVVFKDINLVTHRNELVGIVGPTGTGKSTLVRTIAHLIPPTKGHVFLEGTEVTCPSPKIALIHQSIATFPWMTAMDNVKLSLRSQKLPDAEATSIAERMLDLVGLEGSKDLYPKEMSGGMRQKMTIARALAASPVVLMLDEPFVYLDEITAESLRKEIYRLIFNPESSLKSAILVSHNLREVVELSDRIYILNGVPATIVDEIKVDLPRPRSERAPELMDYVDRLHADLSGKRG
jgi:NitT/TauT family transport system ATP-binding protein